MFTFYLSFSLKPTVLEVEVFLYLLLMIGKIMTPSNVTSQYSGTCDCCYLTCKRDFANVIKDLGMYKDYLSESGEIISVLLNERGRKASKNDLKMLCC